ncbi:hypothetical protein [Synechococcus sp. R3-13]|uniref:hypothetical protein n=1 Tax=Synechococcus sp. R3-13 TaxID=2421316 RepID=UPI0039C06A4F
MSSDLRPPFRPVRPPRPSSTGEAKGSLSSAKAQDPGADRDSGTESLQPVVSTTATLGEKKAAERERVCLEPIPPPGEKMQYRAIGLIEGQYIPSPEHFTRGILRTSDGLDLNAVLLGRVMSLVRKHLKPERNYLWVVYPRTRDKTEDLHVQLLGVWAPEEMGRTLPEGSRPTVVPDWFSIRGEVVFQSQEKGFIIVKIRQSGKKASANSPSQRVQKDGAAAPKPQAFKLRLIGSLPGKGVGNFWDLQVRRRGSLLYVEAGTPIGPVLKTPPRPRLKRSTPRLQKGPLPPPRGQQPISNPQVYPPRDPAKVPKPVKRKRP